MDKTIVQIESELEMLGFLKSNGTSCRFVSMTTQTVVKNIRKGCPFKGVIKISRKRGMINVNYNAAVCRNVAAKLGVEVKSVEYENGEVWYEHLQTVDKHSLPVVVNKKSPNNGKFYLQYFPTDSTNVYRMPDGRMVDEEDLKPWFYTDHRPDFKPTVISIELANIKKLCASGVIMQTEDLAEAQAALANA